MKELARGYIASGEFNGYRVPQHLQNQIVKAYCDCQGLSFVLSRAEYWINGSTECQLWAALKEGIKHIVFFSLWQLPRESSDRIEIYRYCAQHGIMLYFATERMSTDSTSESIADLEILIKTNLIVLAESNNNALELIKQLV